ncbi:MAG: hypothetical protein JNK04_08060 [Myxococcales bacterium]|nr:hypothetical protein [Myxococcales bacterium]
MKAATVGAVENGNSVVLVTVGADRAVLDRRRVDLTEGLPTHPYHHEGAWAVGRYLDAPWAKPMSLPDAIALVERVQAAARAGASAALGALAASVSLPIRAIAIRRCPPLPATTEARIRDNRAQSMADSIMYREALGMAAEANGWTVEWYDRERVNRDAAAVLGSADVEAFVKAMGSRLGPPWQAAHKLAAAAAIAASGRGS